MRALCACLVSGGNKRCLILSWMKYTKYLQFPSCSLWKWQHICPNWTSKDRMLSKHPSNHIFHDQVTWICPRLETKLLSSTRREILLRFIWLHFLQNISWDFWACKTLLETKEKLDFSTDSQNCCSLENIFVKWFALIPTDPAGNQKTILLSTSTTGRPHFQEGPALSDYSSWVLSFLWIPSSNLDFAFWLWGFKRKTMGNLFKKSINST